VSDVREVGVRRTTREEMRLLTMKEKAIMLVDLLNVRGAGREGKGRGRVYGGQGEGRRVGRARGGYGGQGGC
jgi:hypothetical protein